MVDARIEALGDEDVAVLAEGGLTVQVGLLVRKDCKGIGRVALDCESKCGYDDDNVLFHRV